MNKITKVRNTALLILSLLFIVLTLQVFTFSKSSTEEIDSNNIPVIDQNLTGAYLSNTRGVLMFTKEDVDSFSELNCRTEKMNPGFNYYYLDSDMSIKELISQIKPIEKNLLMLLFYSNGPTDNGMSKGYNVFPNVTAFKGKVSYLNENQILPKNRGFLLYLKNETQGCLKTVTSDLTGNLPTIKNNVQGWFLLPVNDCAKMEPYFNRFVTYWPFVDEKNVSSKPLKTVDQIKSSCINDKYNMAWVFLGFDVIEEMPEKITAKPDLNDFSMEFTPRESGNYKLYLKPEKTINTTIPTKLFEQDITAGEVLKPHQITGNVLSTRETLSTGKYELYFSFNDQKDLASRTVLDVSPVETIEIPHRPIPIVEEPQVQENEKLISLKTNDGIELVFDKELNHFTSLELSGMSQPLSFGEQTNFGVKLFDFQKNMILDNDSSSVKSISQSVDKVLSIERENISNGIKITETWKANKNYIELETNIENLNNTERAVEACLNIPADFTGANWYDELDTYREIKGSAEVYRSLLKKGKDIGHVDSNHLNTDRLINLHGINLIASDTFGLSTALNPNYPGAYYVEYDSKLKEYNTCFQLGILPDHQKYPNSANFSLVLLQPDDPKFGLRSAVAKLYTVFPDKFVGTLSNRIKGMTAGPSYKYVQNDGTNFPYAKPFDFKIESFWNVFYPNYENGKYFSLAYIWAGGYLDRSMRLETEVLTDAQASALPSTLSKGNSQKIESIFNLYVDIDNAEKKGSNLFKSICEGASWINCQTNPSAANNKYGPVWALQYDNQGNIIKSGNANVSKWTKLIAAKTTKSQSINYLINNFALSKALIRSVFKDENQSYEKSVIADISPLYGKVDRMTVNINGINMDPGNDYLANRTKSLAVKELKSWGGTFIEVLKRATGFYGEDYLEDFRVQDHEYINNFVSSGELYKKAKYNGVALDTWGAYLRADYNHDTLKFSTYPLSYSIVSVNGKVAPKLVQLEHLGLVAFKNELIEELKNEGPIAISANAMPISGLLYEKLDNIIVEFSRRKVELGGPYILEIYDYSFEDLARRINRMKMAAYQRSISIWGRFVKDETDMDLLKTLNKTLPFYTSKGVYLYIDTFGASNSAFWESAHSTEIISLYKMHLNTVYDLIYAGWEPVPFAASSDSIIMIERYGKKYLTVFNPGSTSKTINVDIDWKAMGLSAAPSKVSDYENGSNFTTSVNAESIMVENIEVKGGSCRVLNLF